MVLQDCEGKPEHFCSFAKNWGQEQGRLEAGRKSGKTKGVRSTHFTFFAKKSGGTKKREKR
jgi:hypothetical protein